jgi:hypothetical protein
MLPRRERYTGPHDAIASAFAGDPESVLNSTWP